MQNLSLPKPSVLFLLIFLFCAGMMATGYFMQYILGLEPCLLCMTQRVFITLTGLVALVAFLHKPKQTGIKLYGAGITLTALTGSGFSIRQLWLQSLPADQVPACGPSFSYIVDTFPWAEAVTMMLKGDGNCAEVAWTFLGVSIPGWTLVCFIAMAVAGLTQVFRSQRA